MNFSLKSRRRPTTRLALALICAGIAVPMIGSTAFADPTGTPTYRQLAGVGSDTTQDVMNAMATAITIGGVKVLGSYNATGSATIATKATAACAAVARPNGSGAGRTALLNSLTAADGCLDWSRSSSLNVTASTPGLTYIPYAIDGVSYAVTPASVVPRTLALVDLQAIYKCDPNYVGTAPNWAITPILPQSGSGTRSFWETQMGITDANVTAGAYPCIINGTKNGQIIEEHSGLALDDKSLVPFSIPQYNSQSYLIAADKRGSAILGTIGTTYPNLFNTSFSVKREVYNVIPTADVTVAPWSTVFVGATSLICTNTAVIQTYGFGLDPACGDTTNHS
jgi:ABC-type phosphate transport system substrate-binding protein